MRKVFVRSSIIIITILAVTSIAFAWGNKKATGKISSINHNGSSPYVTVQGYTEDGKLWLGFSYKCGNGDWEDRKAKKVKGNFKESFTMGMCPQGYSQIRASLWKKKSGRLMEGRVDCMDR